MLRSPIVSLLVLSSAVFWAAPGHTQNGGLLPKFDQFAKTVEQPAELGDTDISDSARELFRIGDDPTPYVAELAARGFRVVNYDGSNSILLSREMRTHLIFSREHRVVIKLDENERIQSVGSFIFTHGL